MTVKHFSSLMPGHPTLSTVLGSAIGLLDACLVTGYGLTPVTSATAVSGSVTLAAAGHVLRSGMYASVSGSANSAVNGEHLVTAVTTSTVTLAVTGVASGSIAGTMAIKVAPLGWTKPFSGMNKAVYRSSTGKCLRVDDTINSAYFGVRGYSAMSDLDLGDNPFPTAAQASGYYWLRQGQTPESPSDIRYLLVGDGRGFYLNVGVIGGAGPTWWFGEIKTYADGDSSACLLAGTPSSDLYRNQVLGDITFGQVTSTPTRDAVIERPASLLGGSTPVLTSPECAMPNPAYSGAGGFPFGAFPNPCNNALRLVPVLCTAGNDVRGELPGLWFVPQAAQGIGFCDTLPGAGATAGRTLIAGKASGLYYSSLNGTVFFDTTGPWR